jgi:prepilin-type N-terminal cleavage/methylation domain-containing protein
MSLNMACKTTFGNGARGFTLVEMLIAVGVGGLLCAGIVSFWFFTSRSLASMANYTDMDRQNQLALDLLTMQIRQVNQLTNYVTSSNGTITSLTFQDYDNASLTFSYSPTNRTLTRTKGGTTQTLLTDCQSLAFSIYQRNVQSNTFDAVTTATATNCKLVEVTWTCAKSVVGLPNTEAMQTTKITIRQ